MGGKGEGRRGAGERRREGDRDKAKEKKRREEKGAKRNEVSQRETLRKGRVRGTEMKRGGGRSAESRRGKIISHKGGQIHG